MRTKDELFALNDISILLQYLYMDEKHSVTFHNGLTDLRIRMTEDFGILCTNLSFPDVPGCDFSGQMTPAYIRGVIEVLKETDPVEFSGRFKSRWEEIKTITMGNLALNRPDASL